MATSVVTINDSCVALQRFGISFFASSAMESAASAGDPSRRLIQAIEKGQAEVALDLIEKGADVDTRDDNDDEKRTVLHLSCYYKLQEVAMALIEKGANAQAGSVIQSQALHFACESGLIDIAMALVEKGADVHAVNNKGYTPLYRACWNNTGNSPLRYVHKDVEALENLFDRLWRATPLLSALHSDDMDRFRAILDDDSYNVNESVNDDDWTALHVAACLNLNMNRMRYIDLLLSHRHCRQQQRQSMFEGSLVDVQARTRSRSLTALHIAASRNDVEAVRSIAKAL